jgi:hypothetical protein
MKHPFSLLLITFLMFSNVGFSVTYTTIGPGDFSDCSIWTPAPPGCPGSVGNIGATDEYVIAHDVNLDFDLSISGRLKINASAELSGNKKINILIGGTLTNDGTIDISKDLHIDGEFYNNGYAYAKKVHNDGYICNVGELEISPSQEFDNHGGTIECGGTLTVCKLKTHDNGGEGLTANISNVNICCSDGSDPIVDFQSGILDSASILYCGILLPVELLNFNLVSNKNNVRLHWVTKSESNNDYFKVFRSDNGIDFEEIGEVAGQGNSSVTHNYKFVDDRPIVGVSYYKLKQVDFDGGFEFTQTLSVDHNLTEGFTIYPNPTNSDLNFVVSIDKTLDVSIEIFDVLGKTVLFQNQSLPEGINSIPLNTESIPKGMYYCRAIFSDGFKMEKTFLKID